MSEQTSNQDKKIIVREGWLKKKGSNVRNWKRRWMVMYLDGTFEYYVNDKKKQRKGFFNLKGKKVQSGYADVKEKDGPAKRRDTKPIKPFSFSIIPPNDQERTYTIQAESEEEYEVWFMQLRAFTGKEVDKEDVKEEVEISSSEEEIEEKKTRGCSNYESVS